MCIRDRFTLEHIIIKDLKVFAHHGVLPEEREKGQDFLIDLEIELDSSAAIGADDISRTIDYAQVVESVSRMATGERYNLIETPVSYTHLRAHETRHDL